MRQSEDLRLRVTPELKGRLGPWARRERYDTVTEAVRRILTLAVDQSERRAGILREELEVEKRTGSG